LRQVFLSEPIPHSEPLGRKKISDRYQ